MMPLSPADVSAGLPAAAAASALLGKSGAAALLILLFLAVTTLPCIHLVVTNHTLVYLISRLGNICHKCRADRCFIYLDI